jgi:hypothetical protein
VHRALWVPAVIVFTYDQLARFQLIVFTYDQLARFQLIVFTYDQLARCQLIVFFIYESYDQLACCQLYYSSVFTVHVKYLCVFHSFDVKLQPCLYQCLYRAYIGVFFYYGGEGGGRESSKQVITITIMLIRASCLCLA